ncbi:MAG: hypothetical protein BWZ07_02318 [Alphaproteobacteria bacterium ADurb.BinA280]|nr:MAG: hypothetical protein BWZ07_02318 [Alphaproteobacteria bacterium ADurb.BinA280]
MQRQIDLASRQHKSSEALSPAHGAVEQGTCEVRIRWRSIIKGDANDCGSSLRDRLDQLCERDDDRFQQGPAHLAAWKCVAHKQSKLIFALDDIKSD